METDKFPFFLLKEFHLLYLKNILQLDWMIKPANKCIKNSITKQKFHH